MSFDAQRFFQNTDQTDKFSAITYGSTSPRPAPASASYVLHAADPSRRAPSAVTVPFMGCGRLS